MKLFLDFFIVALFVLAYHFYGMYTAIAVAMIAYPIQLLISWLLYRTLDKTQLFTAVVVVLLGGATLAFHNDTFFKWKPTIIYWVFGLIALGSQFYGDKVVSERLLGKTLPLSTEWWKAVNITWVIFFLAMGILNLLVVFYCSTTTWVYFKLFGLLGLTMIFMIGQITYLNYRGAIVQNP
jgi:intracellular septation protein